MMDEHDENDNAQFRTWIVAEQWYMRYIGLVLLLSAIVSVFGGVVANPNNENVVRFFNGTITVVMAGGGIWEFWRSSSLKRLQSLVTSLSQQPSEYTLTAAAAQIIMGILFILEGLSGNLTMVLIALMMFSGAGWGFWRRSQAVRYKAQTLD